MKYKPPKPRAAVTKLLDAINKENFNDSHHEKIILNSDSPYQIKKVPTKDCFPWKYANRIQRYVNDSTCAELISNIKYSGQKIPAIARKVNNKYEIICGIRRLYVCNKLHIPILLAIIDVDDKEALLIMDAENRERLDISPYERAIDYKKWVECGIYKNYKEIQELTGIKKSWFSQLISLSELNPEIIKLFNDPINLKQKWGYNLRLLSKDKNNEALMLQTAKIISAKHYKPRTVYLKLLQSCQIDNIKNLEEIVTNHLGEKLFKIKYLDRTTNITINKKLNKDDLKDVTLNLKSLLE